MILSHLYLDLLVVNLKDKGEIQHTSSLLLCHRFFGVNFGIFDILVGVPALKRVGVALLARVGVALLARVGVELLARAGVLTLRVCIT